MMEMYKYELWYDGGLLWDSGDLGYIYETEEEANEEVKVTMEEYIENWEIDGCEDVHEDLFDIEILEVWIWPKERLKNVKI